MIGWENNRAGDITMPLSLKTIGSAGYRDREIRGLDWGRSIGFGKKTNKAAATSCKNTLSKACLRIVR